MENVASVAEFVQPKKLFVCFGSKPARGVVFQPFGRGMQRMCIVVHLGFCEELRGDFRDNLKLALNHCQSFVCRWGERRQRGAGLWCGKCFSEANKEATNSSMTYSLLDPSRHFPKCRSGLRNGHLHRLS